MNKEETNLSASKYVLTFSVLDNKKNKRFFDELDTKLMKKRFDTIYELSLSEHIINAHKDGLVKAEVNKIIDDFIAASQKNDIFEKRNLNELVRLSNLPENKLDKNISDEKHTLLHHHLSLVSRETKFISFDFIILKIIDNFLLRCSLSESNKNNYILLKHTIYQKLPAFKYLPEKKDKESTYLCWIDRILNAVFNKEIKTSEFICICKKIFSLINPTIYIYWKAINSINFLLLRPEFSACSELRKFKIELEKVIEQKYVFFNMTPDELQNLLISTLAKKWFYKEDFYYLLDALRITAQSSPQNKLFCFQLCEYLIYYNKKYNIFNHRFIRKYFTDILVSLVQPDDTFELLEEELQFFIELLHIDVFFCFNRTLIFNVMVDILKNMNNGTQKLTHGHFYKYCDILDFLIYSNPDLNYTNIVDYLSRNNDDKIKIGKHFKLSKFKIY